MTVSGQCLLVFFVCFVGHPLFTDARIRNTRNETNNNSETFKEIISGSDSSQLSLEDALAVISNLTSSQKELWEQQRLREEELRNKTRADLEREEARTRAIQVEHQLLQEMKGKISRKLRAMSNTPVFSSSNQESSLNIGRPKDCAEIYLSAEETSGTYRVWPTWDRDGKGFLVYCDMDTNGGGWTVIRRWGSNKFHNDFFTKTWMEYKTGFGNINGDFWLGNTQIHLLTNQDEYELLLDLKSSSGNVFTKYGQFWIDSETANYKLHVRQMDGNSTAGDILALHNEAPFTASDRNNLRTPQPSHYNYKKPECYLGWWYDTTCSIDTLLSPTSDKTREMKIRPVQFSKLKEAS